MWPHLARFGLQKQTNRRCHRNDVREHNHERQTHYTSDLGNLNKRPGGVQGDSKPVPAKTCEEPSANPFVSDPGDRSQKRSHQISPRSQEMAWPDQTNEPTPKREVEREIDR